MRGTGITYNTGCISGGLSSQTPFDPEIVKDEMRVIGDDLHGTAVCISGLCRLLVSPNAMNSQTHASYPLIMSARRVNDMNGRRT